MTEGEGKQLGRVRTYDIGTVLYREGDDADTMYVVQGGMVALRRQRGKHEDLEQIDRGDFFGEVSVINGSPRQATATVVERARLLEIDRPTFERMLSTNGEIAVRIIRSMATRIDRLSRRPSSSEIHMVGTAVQEKGADEALAASSAQPKAGDSPAQARPSWHAAPSAAPVAPSAAPVAPSAAPVAPSAAPVAPSAAPVAPHTPDEDQPSSWGYGGPPLQPPPQTYLDIDHHQQRRTSPMAIFLLIALTVAGVVGLIAAIVMKNAIDGIR